MGGGCYYFSDLQCIIYAFIVPFVVLTLPAVKKNVHKVNIISYLALRTAQSLCSSETIKQNANSFSWFIKNVTGRQNLSHNISYSVSPSYFWFKVKFGLSLSNKRSVSVIV